MLSYYISQNTCLHFFMWFFSLLWLLLRRISMPTMVAMTMEMVYLKCLIPCTYSNIGSDILSCNFHVSMVTFRLPQHLVTMVAKFNIENKLHSMCLFSLPYLLLRRFIANKIYKRLFSQCQEKLPKHIDLNFQIFAYC